MPKVHSNIDICPHCGEQEVKVIDSRPVEGSREPIRRRRRKCLACSHRWSTYEITDAAFASICTVADLLKELFPGIRRRSAEDIMPAVDEEDERPRC